MSRVKKQITAFSLTLAASLALTAIGASSDSVGKNQTQNMTSLAGMSLVLDQYYSVSKTAEDDILSYLGQNASELVIKDIINMDSKKTTEPETAAPKIIEDEVSEEETEKEIETETETETESETETEVEESGEKESETETETETVKETEPETEATTAYYFDSIAIADVEEGGYVNVRSGPTTSDEIVGKIYHYCAANILDTVDGEGGKWYRIQSGNVNGYMKASFFITGEQAEELAHSIADYQATVLTDGLRVRQSMDLADDNILTLLYIGSQIRVLEQYDEWSKVQVDDDVIGYVYNSNIEVRVIFDTAISLEEEAAIEAQRLEAQRVYEEQMRLLAEAQERERQAQEAAALAAYQASVQESESIRLAQEAEAARIAAEQAAAAAASQAAEQSTGAVEETQPSSEEGTEVSVEETQAQTEPETTPAPETTAPVVVDASTQLRNAAVAYSMQFLGRRYRYGGMDLWGNDGIDCSGFTKRIYENFGIGLEHYSGAQINQGVRVPLDQLLPGDLVFYDTNGTITHVAMYIGNGQIIHAANESYGVCIFDVNYRAPYGACRIIN